MTTFENIIPSAQLLEAIKQLGFSTPTPVQEHTIPLALAGKDLLVKAKTGSGKTFAFGIPMLVQLENEEKNAPVTSTFGLIVSPTRELAQQIRDALATIRADLNPVCLIGGENIETQQRALTKDPRIVVGTPGRILDCIRQRMLQLGTVQFFALDEADEMFSMGFFEDVRAILSRLPKKRQGLFVSATITPRVDMLAHSFLTRPEHVSIDSPEEAHPAIEHLYCEVGGELMAKPSALCDIIETFRPRSAIIFCNTKSDTLMVEALLRRRGFDARRINSDLSQGQRTRIMEKIRAQEIQFLVATDIAARGLDLEQIDLVINFAIHEQPETYIHRTGRTGRAGRSGKAISLIGPRDFGHFHFLKKMLDLKFEPLALPADEEVANARLAHLYEILRTSDIEVRARDAMVARKLLSEMGGLDAPSDEMVELVGQLCRFTVEHFVNAETKGLDEELSALERRPESGDDSEHRTSRRSEERPRRDRKERPERSEHSSRDRHQSDRRDDRGNERPTRQPQDSRDDQQADTVRLFVGQGSELGMTPELIKSIGTEFAEIPESDIRNIAIHEHFSFIELSTLQAEKFINDVNGIQYHGAMLTVERARPKSRNSGRNGRHRERERE